MNSEELTFEQAFTQLEDIVTRLESGELSLDESVALYEQGQKLAQRCNEMLDGAELRIRQLGADGTLEPLE
ncbi:MAG TPA: exodeoxyribonuclease VII small subunit [Aggregatilineaceae bacterium]|nr:exodeoxyribonuclease VII small subunit [Aggregatilineaceae bacterium]